MDEPVIDTETLELELLRTLKDVELMDVLEMGYGALPELDLETGPLLVLSEPVVLSTELVDSLELDDVVLIMVLSSTLEDVI